MLGSHSSSNDAAGIAHVGFVLSRFTLLGQAQAYVRGAPRSLVGREQDWLIAATNRDSERMARVLSRCTTHAFGLFVSAGRGPRRTFGSSPLISERGVV